MAVRLFTTEADTLLSSIKRGIERGEIETWSLDNDGDLTHTASGGQWKNRAYLRPTILNDRLLLNIMIRKAETQKREVYAVYHGRFIEMVISHFPKLLSTAAATPFYTKEDTALNS